MGIKKKQYTKTTEKSKWNLSLRFRLSAMSMFLIVPFFLLTMILVYNMNQIGDSYDRIVQNITQVNEYNLVFKEDMDSVMYLMVAHSLSKYEVKAELGIKPYRKMRSWYWVLPGNTDESEREVSNT